MKQFFQNIFLFIIPLLAVFPIEWGLRKLPNDYRLKKNYYENNGAQVNTLILGNSHAYLGINPVYFDEHCFNGAHLSQSLDYDLMILEKHLKNLTNLKTVILPISYFSLFYSLNHGETSWFLKNYELYYNFETPNPWRKNTELFQYEPITNLYKLYCYHLKGTNPIHCSDQGWATVYSSRLQKNLETTGIENAKRHTYTNLSLFNQNTQILQQIITKCAQNKINVLLVTTPSYITYRDQLDTKQLQLTYKTAKKISQKNNNCDYINLLNHPDFIAVDFYDASHLNEKGAEKLSLLLNNYLKKHKNDSKEVLTN